jgi:SAM-dependent methyltransferase
MRQSISVRDRSRIVHEFFQDQWFDRTRNVHTSGDVSLRKAGIAPEEVRDSEWYVPARPVHIRQALAALPTRDVSGYSYVDFGSGKGRTLFVAAELPFRQIIGVERSSMLHRQACANIRNFRFWKVRCRRIESIHADAVDFRFPDSKLVVYFFNPFGADTMRKVMKNLASSLERNPRHVVVVLLWPRCGDQVLEVEGMRVIRSTQRHQIFAVYNEDVRSQQGTRAHASDAR